MLLIKRGKKPGHTWHVFSCLTIDLALLKEKSNAYSHHHLENDDKTKPTVFTAYSADIMPFLPFQASLAEPSPEQRQSPQDVLVAVFATMTVYMSLGL